MLLHTEMRLQGVSKLSGTKNANMDNFMACFPDSKGWVKKIIKAKRWNAKELTVAQFQNKVGMQATHPEMLAVNLCVLGSTLLPTDFHILCDRHMQEWKKRKDDFKARHNFDLHPRLIAKAVDS